MHNEVVIALQKDNEVIIVTDMAGQISTKEALYFKIITVQQITSFLNYQDFGRIEKYVQQLRNNRYSFVKGRNISVINENSEGGIVQSKTSRTS